MFTFIASEYPAVPPVAARRRPKCAILVSVCNVCSNRVYTCSKVVEGATPNEYAIVKTVGESIHNHVAGKKRCQLHTSRQKQKEPYETD